MATARHEALRLYRRILTLHRRKLDPRMRVLGDAYVRDEFRRHKDAAPKFVPLFMSEWEKYATALEKQKDQVSGLLASMRDWIIGLKYGNAMSQFGRELLESEKSLLSGEQKEKLETLKDAARSVGQAMS